MTERRAKRSSAAAKLKRFLPRSPIKLLARLRFSHQLQSLLLPVCRAPYLRSRRRPRGCQPCPAAKQRNREAEKEREGERERGSQKDSVSLSHSGLRGADDRDPMPSCHKSRRDRLTTALEHEGSSAAAAVPMRRGRPISRGAGALGLLILRPVQYTAALRLAARPANPSTKAFRSFPSGRGPQHCNSSSRKRGGASVTLASSNDDAEMTGGAGAGAGAPGAPGAGATRMMQQCSPSARRGSGGQLGSSSTVSSFAGRSHRLAFVAQGRGMQEQAVARRRAVPPRYMSQTSRPVFPPQQTGDRRDGSPAAGSGRVTGREDECHSKGDDGKRAVGVREQQQQQQKPASLHGHPHQHHNSGAHN